MKKVIDVCISFSLFLFSRAHITRYFYTSVRIDGLLHKTVLTNVIVSENRTQAHTHTPYLPYSYNGIGDENEEDHDGFYKGRDCPLSFFKPCQHLQHRSTSLHRIDSSSACAPHSFTHKSNELVVSDIQEIRMDLQDPYKNHNATLPSLLKIYMNCTGNCVLVHLTFIL